MTLISPCRTRKNASELRAVRRTDDLEPGAVFDERSFHRLLELLNVPARLNAPLPSSTDDLPHPPPTTRSEPNVPDSNGSDGDRGSGKEGRVRAEEGGRAGGEDVGQGCRGRRWRRGSWSNSAREDGRQVDLNELVWSKGQREDAEKAVSGSCAGTTSRRVRDEGCGTD